MLEEIRKRLLAHPFRAFIIRMADGREYPVPTADHVWVTPKSRLWVEDDGGGSDALSTLLIASIRENGPTVPSAQ
ncbi:MAG: hypothetical protein JO117_10695 [Verrucomicrobia bacterium]|nr:hypothetical protein [Verrucomicrobiota bacterium]MBV9658171.1 hypothetical protein [Verrucomicrobiota bacterium]